jgi:hypothetical protein
MKENNTTYDIKDAAIVSMEIYTLMNLMFMDPCIIIST